MTCRRQALPPEYAARTKAEATEILGNPNATESLKRLAWRVLREDLTRRGPMCSENGILGYSNREIAAINRRRKPIKPEGDAA